MRTIQVTYDLHNPGRNYQPLWEYLRAFDHIHPLESTWFIRTTKATQGVCEDLLARVDRNDDVACIDVTTDAWWARLDQQSLAWLKRHVSPAFVRS